MTFFSSPGEYARGRLSQNAAAVWCDALIWRLREDHEFFSKVLSAAEQTMKRQTKFVVVDDSGESSAVARVSVGLTKRSRREASSNGRSGFDAINGELWGVQVPVKPAGGRCPLDIVFVARLGVDLCV